MICKWSIKFINKAMFNSIVEIKWSLKYRMTDNLISTQYFNRAINRNGVTSYGYSIFIYLRLFTAALSIASPLV
jgi:hypothetical protein